MAALVDSSDKGVPAGSGTLVKLTPWACGSVWQVHDGCSVKRAYGAVFTYADCQSNCRQDQPDAAVAYSAILRAHLPRQN